jgi:His-Xaa-Ser system protein HxsD
MKGFEITQGSEGLPVATAGGLSAAVEIDLGIYSLEAVLRACYKLTDRCYLLLARGMTPDRLLVFTQAKHPEQGVEALIGELANELLDQQLRRVIAEEAGAVRELIVAQAFAEGNLLDGDRDDGDYEADPRGIGRRR